jgi:hypothetical protein
MCSHKDCGGVVVGVQHQDIKIAVSRLVEIPAREIGLCRLHGFVHFFEEQDAPAVIAA